MIGLEITRHARVRMSQRNITAKDVDLIVELGVETPDGFILTDATCDELQRELHEAMRRVERARRKCLVCVDGVLVTAYRASATQTKRLRRRARDCGAD